MLTPIHHGADITTVIHNSRAVADVLGVWFARTNRNAAQAPANFTA
jgi:hypothetical protein